MSNDFSNEDFNEMLKEMERQNKESKGNLLYWNPKNEGIYPIRFISPLTKTFGEKLFYQAHRLHYINKKPYFCLAQTLTDKNGNVHEAEECPVCKKVKQLYAISTGKESEEAKIASSINAKDRYVSRIIVRGLKDEKGNDIESTPQFYEFGQKIYTYIFSQMKLGECGNFLSMKDGRDFNLSKVGTGKSTDYSGSSISMKQSPIFTDPVKIQTLLDKLKSMDYSQLVEFQSAETLKELLREFFNEPGETKTETRVETSAPEIDNSFEDAIFGVTAQTSEKTEATKEMPDDIDALLNSI